MSIEIVKSVKTFLRHKNNNRGVLVEDYSWVYHCNFIIVGHCQYLACISKDHIMRISVDLDFRDTLLQTKKRYKLKNK